MNDQASSAILSDLPCVPLADGLAGRVHPGEGEKVLWLHGYTLDSSSWGDLWRRLPGWHHVGIDFPGHGGSGPIHQAGNLPALGRRLGQFCLDQGIRHIVALSFGTITATQIAIEYPTSFASIVLSAPSLAGGAQESDVAQVYMRLFQLFHEKGPGPEMADLWLGCRVWSGIDQYPGLPAALRTIVDRHSWEEMRSYAMRHLTQPAHQEADLRKIQSQVLVVIGEHEMAAFRASAQMLCRTLPHCELLELPGAGHLCLLQTPGAAADAIDAHLRKHAGQAPA